MAGDGGKQGMVRVLGLNQHLAPQFRPPGTARDLHQLGEKAFRCPPVGSEQGCVRAQHANQRQPWKIMSLGQHLRADQNIGLAAMDLRQYRLPLAAGFHRVTVNPNNARIREFLLQPAFNALRAAAEGMDVLVATGRAGARHAVFVAAMVTAQTLVGHVQHQIGGTTAATRHPATGRATQHRRIAPPVEENQALLATRQARLDALHQQRTDAFAQRHAPRIEHLDGRQRSLWIGPPGHRQQTVTAMAGIAPGLQRRRRRAEQNRDIELRGAKHRDVTR